MGRLLLLRHGQSTWNATGRWQGWADAPLSPAGEDQARAAARLLAGAGIARVASSDLQRARHTAELIAADMGLGEVVVDAWLRERDVGDWTGLETADIDERWPGQLDAWRDGRLERPPNGESDVDMLARVRAALARLAGRDGTTLVVTHGGVIHLVVHAFGGRALGVANLAGHWLEEGLVLGEPHGDASGRSGIPDRPTTLL